MSIITDFPTTGATVMGISSYSNKTQSVTMNMNEEDSVIPNPYKLNLGVAQFITIPSYVMLAVTSTTLLYIIYKHFRSLLEIYISVIFYLISQLLFLLTLTASWVTELIYPEETRDRCHVKLAFQSFAVILPGYAILIITISRAVFLSYPLRYLSYLKLKFQLLSFVTAALICGLISTLPLFGVCPAEPLLLAPGLEICSYGDRREPSCTVFYSVLLVLGFFLPLLAVISLYIYIYKVVLAARKSHLQLSSTASATTTVEGMEGVDQQAEQRIEQRTELKEEQRSEQSAGKREGRRAEQSAGRRRGGRSEQRTERRSVPWSILAILVMTVSTTVPWGVMTSFTVEMTKMITEGGDISRLFDLFYSLLQVLIGCSPLVYLLTTNSLRTVVFNNLRKVVAAMKLGKEEVDIG